MGNEGSNLNNVKIEENATEITECWSLFKASTNDNCKILSLHKSGFISVFKGERISGPLWTISTPLEKFSNNILKYRHPCIIRYLSSWQQRSIFYLATEYVLPLSHILQDLCPLQLCIGLNDILRAIVFLHHQAGMSHNNVCMSAVYVTEDGQWKLGGLQYVCSFDELTPAYLKLARLHRYDKAVDPNENSQEITSKVDHYAYAALVEDVFKSHKNEDVPHLGEFKKYCLEVLQNPDPKQRVDLSEVLEHDFFNHEFISIYKFLTFLPLKTENERKGFFNTIVNNLRCYDEETVSKQLSSLLLSRITMMDQTAQNHVVPFILQPENERAVEKSGLFSLPVFKKYVKPKILQLFGVRDKLIRTQLLIHFSKFLHVFTHEELSHHILPELLLGIKDKDDSLVASTLVCLSELVPILGADMVIGGKRSKIFTDGQPKTKSLYSGKSNDCEKRPRKNLCDFPCSEEIMEHSKTDCTVFDLISTCERPSPVGGESVEITPDNHSSDLEWSDWDQNKKAVLPCSQINQKIVNQGHNETGKLDQKSISSMSRVSMYDAALKAKKNMIDIAELDIKNQKVEISRKANDMDYFVDMMPVIEKPSVIDISPSQLHVANSDRFNFIPNLETSEDCWEDGWS